jgi:hypothetical protein
VVLLLTLLNQKIENFLLDFAPVIFPSVIDREPRVMIDDVNPAPSETIGPPTSSPHYFNAGEEGRQEDSNEDSG